MSESNSDEQHPTAEPVEPGPDAPFLLDPDLAIQGSRGDALGRAMAGTRRAFSVRVEEVLGEKAGDQVADPEEDEQA